MLISDSHVEPLVVHQHALHFLQEIMPKIKLSLPLPFYGGAVGYIGYDTIQSFEDIGASPFDDRDMPDIHLMLFEDTIIFDHEENKLHFIAIDRNGDAEEKRAQRIQKLKQYVERPNILYFLNHKNMLSLRKQTRENSKRTYRLPRITYKKVKFFRLFYPSVFQERLKMKESSDFPSTSNYGDITLPHICSILTFWTIPYSVLPRKV